MHRQDGFVLDELSEKLFIQRETSGSTLETGYWEQWDQWGHLHGLQQILDLLEPLHAKVLNICNPGDVFRSLLKTLSCLIFAVGVGRSGSIHASFQCSLGVLGSPGSMSKGCYMWVQPYTEHSASQPWLLFWGLDLKKSYCTSARVKIHEKRLYSAIEQYVLSTVINYGHRAQPGWKETWCTFTFKPVFCSLLHCTTGMSSSVWTHLPVNTSDIAVPLC